MELVWPGISISMYACMPRFDAYSRISERSAAEYHSPWPYAPLEANSGIEGISSGLAMNTMGRQGEGGMTMTASR